MKSDRRAKAQQLPRRGCLDPRLLEKLRCPACGGNFKQEDKSQLLCDGCARRFPVVDGIPDLVYYAEKEAGHRVQAEYERELHDQAAPDEYEDRVVKVYGDKTELIAAGWAKAFPGPILDYGCGTGQLSRVLTRRHCPVYAFDISTVSAAKNARENHVLAVSANALHLPFKDRCFETVCCNGVLHHITDLGAAIHEMARVANRSIAISEPCTAEYYRTAWRSLRRPGEIAKALFRAVLLRASCLRQALSRRVGRSSPSRGSGGASAYERPLDPKEVLHLLAQAGFEPTPLRFWTNLGWKRRSRLKKVLTRVLVSYHAGSHFEARAERPENRETAPGTVTRKDHTDSSQ